MFLPFLPFLPIDIDENKEKEANARWTCCTTCKNKRCKREADGWMETRKPKKEDDDA